MILHIDIYRYSIPMHPFTIATGTMHFAQNILIRVHTESGLSGLGECSAFPMITGESQSTCFEMAREFAAIWKGKNEGDIEERMLELHHHAAFNSTIKSAFDMALFDLAAKKEGLPLYAYLGGKKKPLETDLTIGIASAEEMAIRAKEYIEKGVRIIKVKLGKDAVTDIQRIKSIREAIGPRPILRIDANQGWSFDDAINCLQSMERYNIEFCEQPMRYWNDDLLPTLMSQSPIPIMADESVFDHHDARRLIHSGSCDYINIKFAKSGGILEAKKIIETCERAGINTMMGGMLESRLALTAFAHFAMANNNIRFYDMDTCMLGHKTDPVINGVQFDGFILDIPELPGIGADVDPSFLENCERIRI